MRPFLDLYGFVLPFYGLAMAVGYLVGVLLAARTAERHGISFNRVLDLSFWLLAAGLLGSRLLFVITNPGMFYRMCAFGDPPAPRGGLQVVYDRSWPLVQAGLWLLLLGISWCFYVQPLFDRRRRGEGATP